MNAVTQTFSALLLAVLLTPVQATLPEEDAEAANVAETSLTRDFIQPRKTLDQLQIALQELKSLLADPAHDIALVKTKTSWIRKYLTSLQRWAEEQPAGMEQNIVMDDFQMLIDDMTLEVTRDDMLDANELGTLMTNYIRAENLFYQLESEHKSE